MAVQPTGEGPSPIFPANVSPVVLPPQGYTAPFRPIVLPQVAKSSQSTIITPFLRAYSHTISSPPYSITQPDFLTFLDGLNAVWIANPILQATSIAGQVMGVIHPVEIAGLVLETVSEVASEGSSYLRTRRYLKKMNAVIFEPRGLRVRICGFEDMLDTIGVSERWVTGCLGMRKSADEEAEVTLEDLERLLASVNETGVERVHPRLRLLHALEGYVALLERVDMPVDTQQQSNVLRRLHASYAAREEQKRTEGLEKKQNEGRKRQAGTYQEAIEGVQRKNREIAKIQERITKVEAERGEDEDEEESTKKIDRLTAEIRKVEKEKQKKVKEKLRHAEKGLEKLEQKEMEETMKIKWLVISRIGNNRGCQRDCLNGMNTQSSIMS
ncbi:hypothetical protein BJX68DRAFT_260982 [Aspergillus pseudodeflectus]|uniref:Uncharacterized protein n=1 Tax=Aspergillus pseudodeflectus TaxID=176178 RepID=A0ABR4L629_9EURO